MERQSENDYRGGRRLTFQVSYDLKSPSKKCGCSSLGKLGATEEFLSREVTCDALVLHRSLSGQSRK